MDKKRFTEIMKEHGYPERLIEVIWDDRLKGLTEEEVRERATVTKDELKGQFEELKILYKIEDYLHDSNIKKLMKEVNGNRKV